MFYYIYAVLHSPTYRSRYAEFLKIDFPRVSVTSSKKLFADMCALGAELVSLHLLESPTVHDFMTRYPIPGNNRVEKGYPRFVAPGEREPGATSALRPGRVYVNKEQYFEGVPPEVWDFHIGGYQVCNKWLKDRRSRALSYNERLHYQKVIIALAHTLRIMDDIDDAVDSCGGWPDAFTEQRR